MEQTGTVTTAWESQSLDHLTHYLLFGFNLVLEVGFAAMDHLACPSVYGLLFAALQCAHTRCAAVDAYYSVTSSMQAATLRMSTYSKRGR